jgi:nitrogen fixation/metabolism regulation signal transduction histidine kinase
MKEGDEPLNEAARARRRGAPWLFGGLVLVLLSALVVLQVFGLWEMFTPDTASDTLLIYALSTLNFVAFFLFSFIFIRSLLKLRRERRASMLGSKIKTRLVVYFIAVSLLPITGMALFSYMFFNRSLEKWFGSFPQDVARKATLAQEEDALQHAAHLRRDVHGERQPDQRIELINCPECRNPAIELRHATPVTEARFASIAAARIDAC